MTEYEHLAYMISDKMMFQIIVTKLPSKALMGIYDAVEA